MWSPERAPPGQPLSKWLSLMLAEITRKREEREQARVEALQREVEQGAGAHNPSDAGAGI